MYRRISLCKLLQGDAFYVALDLILPQFNPLNAELNPICHLLALLGGATIVVVSRLRINIRMQRTLCLPCYSVYNSVATRNRKIVFGSFVIFASVSPHVVT